MQRIEAAKQSAVNGMEYFLRNFSYVPDAKLTWSPAPTSKSALRIAAHTALSVGRFASMIVDRRLPNPDNWPEWLAQREADELALTDRDEVEKAFRAGTEAVLAALDTLTEDELDASVDSGQGWSMPITQLIGLAGWHATLHAGQIDYLQTCWDDQKIYVE